MFTKIVGDYVFYDNGTDIYLVKYLGNEATITLPKYDGGKEYKLHTDAFYNCQGITSITIENYVTTIARDTFRKCETLTTVILGDSVTKIEGYAFRNCTALTKVVISDSVTTIGGIAFDGCSSLTLYCEPSSEPSGWGYRWNWYAGWGGILPVVWGYKA